MQFEAEVPRGVHAGQTFDVQTPSGLVALQAPPGCTPGQKVTFFAPGHAPGQTPVLQGTVVGAPQQTMHAPVSAGYRPGCPYRTDPLYAQVDTLPLLKGIPVEKAERKVQEIRRGAELAREWPAFPARRQYRDSIWILPFLAVVAAVIAAAVYFSDSLDKRYKGDVGEADIGAMVASGAAGGAASLVAAMAFAGLARAAPGCVVWTSLVFGPALMIAGGAALLVLKSPLAGGILVMVGVLSLACVFCCYRGLIPFMIKVVETVARVITENPMMLAVSLLGSVMGLAWSLVCGLAFVGAALRYEDQLDQASKGARYGVTFGAVLVFVWGAQVAYNICHVTYCGVFGRWYYRVDQGAALRKSLLVAATTSFGSICFGSFLIAAVRALEAMLRQARSDAQQDGNAVCCVVLMLVECVVSCLGDILEYFSEWAYVQCAVRGVSFVEGARITYSMMTCANLFFVLQDLLINSVVNLSALLCAAVGCAAGAGTGAALGETPCIVAGAIIGAWSGLLAGGSAAGILSSGTKTILALWAEDPEPLRRSEPSIHQEFEARIMAKLDSL